jgi:hypothetical protein
MLQQQFLRAIACTPQGRTAQGPEREGTLQLGPQRLRQRSHLVKRGRAVPVYRLVDLSPTIGRITALGQPWHE